MKKYVAIILSACMLFGVSACSNNSNNSNIVSSVNKTKLNDEYYNYGVKALEAVDQYLGAETEKEELYSTITSLQERIEESEDYSIETLNGILKLFQMSLDDDDLDIDDIREYRDDLAVLLKNPLQYRDTSKKTFDITSEKFFAAMNTALQSIDDSLVLNDFTKLESEDEEYFDTAYYSTEKNGITIKYSIDKKTDRLAYLRFSAELDNPSENDYLNLASYWGITIGILDSDSDTDTITKELKLSDFSDRSYGNYKSDNAEYTKDIFKNSYSFYVRP